MYCVYCGAKNEDSAKFCARCGCSLDTKDNKIQNEHTPAHNSRGIAVIIVVLIAAAAAVITAFAVFKTDGDVGLVAGFDSSVNEMFNENDSGENSDLVSGEDSDAAGGEDSDALSGEDPDVVSGEDSDAVSGEDSDAPSGEDSDVVSGEDSDALSGEDSDAGSGENSDAVSGGNQSSPETESEASSAAEQEVSSQSDEEQSTSAVYMTVVNCNEWISLRTSPSTNAARYCKIPLGATVEFINTSTNGFLEVSYNGYTGYALAEYLSR